MTEENKLGGFDFAIQQLKQGLKLARVGWNGKGMWIALVSRKFMFDDTNEDALYLCDALDRYVATQTECLITTGPFLIMKTADNKIVMGWLASQTDILAEDWMVVQ